MKILLEHAVPFFLAHGGTQVQIEQTKKALEAAGVEVEFLRWWDDSQTGDLIHIFGGVSGSLISAARLKRIPVVATSLFSATCNRSDAKLRAQGAMIKLILSIPFGGSIKSQLTWKRFGELAHNIVGLNAERDVLKIVYGIPEKAVSVVPLGLSQAFLKAGPGTRSQPHLISVGTVNPIKNTVSLARLAMAAEVPVLFVGNPYESADPYWKEFEALIDGRWVLHQPHVQDQAALIKLYQESRGFVMMSRWENWCLAAHEAAACGIPVLLPDLKWSRERFGSQARYLDPAQPGGHAALLRKFYDDAPALPAPAVRLFGWPKVAAMLKDVYTSVLSTSA